MSTTRLLAVALTAALGLVADNAVAQEKARRQRPQQVPPTGAEDSTQPTADEQEGLRTLDAITSRSIEGLTFEERADGTIGLDLQGRFMHVLTAGPGKDGRLDISCHTRGKAGDAAVAAVPLWNPQRGQGPRLTVKPLPAPIVVASRKAPAAEEK